MALRRRPTRVSRGFPSSSIPFFFLLLSYLLPLLFQSRLRLLSPDFLCEDFQAELLLFERRAVASFDALDEGLVLSLPLVSQPSFLLEDGFLILVLLLVMGADLAEVGSLLLEAFVQALLHAL